MKRDMELVRDIMEFLVTHLNYNKGLVIYEPSLNDKWTMDDYNHHLDLCGKAGFLELERIDRSTPVGAKLGEGDGDFLISGITWSGYNLLETLRESQDYNPKRSPIGFAVSEKDQRA